METRTSYNRKGPSKRRLQMMIQTPFSQAAEPLEGVVAKKSQNLFEVEGGPAVNKAPPETPISRVREHLHS